MTASRDQASGLRIGPSGRAALRLLAYCPWMPTGVLRTLLGHRQAVTTAQLLARLRRAGLAQYRSSTLGPLLGSRPLRLWTLSSAGRAFVASQDLRPPPNDTGWPAYGEAERQRDPSRQRDVPLLVAAYRLLAAVATGLERPVHVGAWEHPWMRTLSPAGSGHRRHVRLPAGAVLRTRQRAQGQPPLRVLLLPDLGTAPLTSYRPTLQALIALRGMAPPKEADEPVLVIGVATVPQASAARVHAWRSLLQEVARRADDRPLRARVLALDGALAGQRADTRRLAGQVDEVFALVARHPLLTRQQLASLLGTSAGRVARLEADLVARGWLRPVVCDDLPRGSDGRTRNEVLRLGLVELTVSGRREAARRLLVPARLARRRHGLTGGDRSRHRFLRQLHHTLGANAFFVDLAAAARQVTRRGGDEALVEWRSAAACARGRCRPDGYGCYRRGPWHFGFFLEYDRGTERPGQYAAKLATYYRYRDAGTSKYDYQSFPSLLVVCTNAAAEARFAQQAYLAHQRYGGRPLLVYLTTSHLIDACRDGALGAIWRSATAPWATEPARGCWLPRLPRSGPYQEPKGTPRRDL